MRKAAFPPSSSDLQYPPPHHMGIADRRVYKVTVRRALIKQLHNKAPGLDQLNFGALRLHWIWDARRIMSLVRHCIRLGYHPQTWKRTKKIMLRKPNQLD